MGYVQEKDMHQVTLLEAEQNLRDLVSQVATGGEIMITDMDRHPVARLAPVRVVGALRLPGWAKDKIWMADDFDAPLDDFKEYLT